ncbi:MAG: alcohol dehydrogenase catalytic domain-containing protein [Phycisphaerae bacterium]|nr:alcohol dehydrogenase catalytic domain-containing protein [Phycisphaerae bacterium]MDD5381621.1 alcohol dehydrogenase catalytic domain-containing protein [Phycisphaerae bacterium]
MKAIVLTGIRQMKMTNVPEPVIKKDDEILLKVEAVGVCGSDVHYYETGRIGSQIVKYPFVVGHECAATVEAVGCAVTRVRAGDNVVVEPSMACNNCDQCKSGRKNTCRNLKFLGCPGQAEGCLCEYIIMPEDCCFPIDEKITFEQGVLCEPLAIGIYAVKQAHLSENTDIAILGTGPIGLSCLVSAKAKNVNSSYVTEKIKERMEAAKNNGASWVGNPNKEDIVKEILRQKPSGVDVAFECAGQQETIDQAVEILKPGGKLMLVGIPRLERISFSIDKIRRKEITIVNVRRQNECTQAAIDMIADGKIDVDFMITHRFKLEQTQQAFDMVAEYRDGVIKALIEL